MVKKKHGFTILEVLIMVIILGVSLVAIIVTLNNGMSFIQKTREKTIAINLAREGIEAMYQIRDTNWSRWAGKKEQCRLKIDPLKTSSDCANDTWMQTGNYILLTATTGGQQYFYLSGGTMSGLNLTDGGIDTGDRQFALCAGETGRYACPGNDPVTVEGKFFRQIQGIGLFSKNSNVTGGTVLSCTNGAGACSGTDAKEYRFCSTVAYIGRGQGKVELCGLLTNFQKK